VGYVPVLKSLLRPFDDPVVALLIPVVPVPVELPTLLEPTAPVAAAPPVPPAPCPRAMEEVTARTEAKAIVVSFMWFFPAVERQHRETVTSRATAQHAGRAELGRLEVVPLGEPAHS
jgi:hypothetical protein